MILSRVVRVRGTEVRYDVTGRGERDLVLIHGHHAHHMWWHGIVPYLEENWRVTQLDLSGHGDSGHRDDYDSGRVWTDDVRAVVKAAGCERPVLVGHSMGGRVAVTVAGGHLALSAGVIMFDSVIRAPADRPLFAWRPQRRPRIHPSREVALSRFRLSPEQPPPPEPKGREHV
jgi:pimeloyl-ACP methyl ester carboxylesterase